MTARGCNSWLKVKTVLNHHVFIYIVTTRYRDVVLRPYRPALMRGGVNLKADGVCGQMKDTRRLETSAVTADDVLSRLYLFLFAIHLSL